MYDGLTMSYDHYPILVSFDSTPGCVRVPTRWVRGQWTYNPVHGRLPHPVSISSSSSLVQF